MKANKKRFIFIISGATLFIAILVTAIILTIRTNTKYLSGSTFNIGETDFLPTGVEELSYTKINPKDSTKKAAVLYDDVYKEFDSVKEAYDLCNTREFGGTNYRNYNITLIFFDDWIAIGENGFGEGVGYGEAGSISPAYRETKLTINLNGYTLGRKLETTIDNGSVIILDESYDLNIYNGYISGGKTTGNGGGIFVDCVSWDTNIYLKNVHIKENQADGMGGGIFTAYREFDKNSSSIYYDNLYLNNTSIYYNIAKVGGGGMYSDVDTSPCYTVNVYLEDRVFINNNKCSDDSKHHNYTLGQTDHIKFSLFSTENLVTGSCIYISFSNNTSDTSSFSEECKDIALLESVKNYFYADDSNRKIILVKYDDSSCELSIANNSGC